MRPRPPKHIKEARNRKRFPLETVRYCPGLSSDGSENPLDRLSSYARSLDREFHDPVFVSLDTEVEDVRKIGISIFDTRDLTLATAKSDLSTVISTYNYIMRQAKGQSGQRKFKFGTSQWIEKRWVPWLLNKDLEIGTPDPAIIEPRHVVLIGHSVGSDLQTLERVPLGLNPTIDNPILDTAELCREVFNLDPAYVPELMNLIEWLEVDHKHVRMHNAGNDADITLKVFLKLALESRSRQGLRMEEHNRRDLLNAVIDSNAVGWPNRPKTVDTELIRELSLRRE